MQCLDENKLLFPFQFGFQSKMWTELAATFLLTTPGKMWTKGVWLKPFFLILVRHLILLVTRNHKLNYPQNSIKKEKKNGSQIISSTERRKSVITNTIYEDRCPSGVNPWTIIVRHIL